ncbi:hypothetical protein SmJEL517_g03446 [Synchytrium microbalum]|uniref:Alpha/beta hydrolase fold-3 domain-containing protein n=1 Tax=Synchytrium microbalum TaxID=1806994 RepID=A0A507C2P6_9FUNG|nr:uncharacterized protein SmJEL517_g03446 [Synchytrium microbalum]TPX33701.1 hypothetical protein SmJEL517_g03446 [Synchytrium microbalum]
MSDGLGSSKRPTWSPLYVSVIVVIVVICERNCLSHGVFGSDEREMKVKTFRNAMKLGVDRLDLLQPVNEKFINPLPPGRAWVEHTTIPRLSHLILDGMTPDQATGTIRAEWVQDARLKQSKHQPAERVILYIHGGAYVVGSPASHRPITWRMSKHAQARIFAPRYRLAPKHVFPLALQDVLCAYLYLVDPPSPVNYRYAPEQIVFMGDSAGGGLAWAAMLYIRDHAGKFPMPAGICGIAPWLDLTHLMPSFLDNGKWDYLPTRTKDPKHTNKDRLFPYVKHNDDMPNPYVSPLYAKEDPNVPICPVLIQIGEAERLRDESIYWAFERFKNSPVRLEMMEDQVHVYHLFESSKSIAGKSYQRFGEFIREVTSLKGRPFVVGDRAVLIRNQRPAYPIESLKDPLRFVREGLERRGQRLEDVGRWLDARARLDCLQGECEYEY